jgi:ankyrin repeat protein
LIFQKKYLDIFQDKFVKLKVKLLNDNAVDSSPSFEKQVFEMLTNSDAEIKVQMIRIEELLRPFDAEKIEEHKKALQDGYIVTHQSNVDEKFSILWKQNGQVFVLNMFDNIKKEYLSDLCKFIVEFINKCLDEDHCGKSCKNHVRVFSSFIIFFLGLSTSDDHPLDQANLDLQSLQDKDGLNLLFYAAQNGKSEMVKILLEIAFNVNMMHNQLLPVDFAYTNQHFDTLLVLLKANSFFPYGFDATKCPEDVRAFAEMSQKFHQHILDGNTEEIENIIKENPDLRYFYNYHNQSASSEAIYNKKFKVYELLMARNLNFSIWEELDEITEGFTNDEKREIREIHFNNKKHVAEKHIQVLMSKSFVGHDDFDVQDKLDHVMRAFKTLNGFVFIQILLKIAAMLHDLHIIFDFNRDSVEYLDPTQDRSTLGLFYFNGRIYVGAKQLLDPQREHEVFATIAHELCHFVLFIVFGKHARPYKENETAIAAEFETISQECEAKKDKDKIVGHVYSSYPIEEQHAELIVRVPHFFAHYSNQPDMITKRNTEFKSLFDFYESKVVPQLETALVELRKMAEKDLMRKDKKIARLIQFSVFLFVFLSALTVIVGFVFYEPTYKWSELDGDQKARAFHGNVKFQNISLKFKDLYGLNENSSVFNVLNSQQIDKLMRNETIDLSQAENNAMENEILLNYQNMTEKLREKVEKASIEFQGQQISVKNLLVNGTQMFLNTLNSEKTIELVKNQSLIQIGEKLEIDTNFYIERRFIDKKLNKNINFYKRQSLIQNSTSLISESVREKFISLSGDAGTGKTIAFKNLALKLKQKFPFKWVKFVDMKAHIDVYKKIMNENMEIMPMLTEIFNLNSLNLTVFGELYRAQNVIFLWDGFDEISPKYSDFMLKLMLEVKTFSQNIQFLSTRPHCENDITKYLNCTIFMLRPYEKAENVEFLDKFYTHKLLNITQRKTARKNVKKLIKKIQTEHEYIYPKPYIESPLLLEMVAEVSIDNENILDTTNFYTMYGSFISSKLKISSSKGDLVQTEKNKYLGQSNFNLMEIHQYFAIKFLFEDEFEHLKISRRYSKQKLDINELSRFGILIFDSNGKAHFFHRTFAEFFVAQYFVSSYYEMDDDPKNDEIVARIKFMLEKLIEKKQPKIYEFVLNYIEKSETISISNEIMKTFRINFNLVFYQTAAYNERYRNSIQTVRELIQIFIFDRETFEVLWEIDESETFFSWWATRNPSLFLHNYIKIIEICRNIFLTESEKRKMKFVVDEKIERILYGKDQKGNFIYAIYDKAYFDKDVTSYNSYLNSFSIKVDFEFKELIKKRLFSLSSFYQFITPHLSIEEIKQFFTSNFVEILYKDFKYFWNKIHELFSLNEIQELIYRKTKTGKSILYYIKDTHILKTFLTILKGTSNSKFLNFLFDSNNKILIEIYVVRSYENFEIFWNATSQLSTFDDRRTILKASMNRESFETITTFKFESNLFVCAVEFGSPQVFERVKNVYVEHFNEKEMQEFCRKYFEHERHYAVYKWSPQIETADAFLKYMKTIFNAKDFVTTFREPLTELFKEYGNINSNLTAATFPFFISLKTMLPAQRFDELNKPKPNPFFIGSAAKQNLALPYV